MTKCVYIFAGEQSGDNLGAGLVRALNPLWIKRGVAGPAMRKEGVIGQLRMEDFAVMGITDVLWQLPKLIRKFKQVRDEILNLSPDVVVLIDYPVFNIRLAKALRKKGFAGKLVHYVCPSVWAHGKGRIQQMAKTLDLLLTIFPFEPPLFAHTPLKTIYIGNPIAEAVQNHIQNNSCNFKDCIALFPGSRKSVIAKNLPLQLKACELYRKKYPEAKFVISCAHEDLRPLFPKTYPLVPAEQRFELMRTCKAALATSGTITLELALNRCPAVINYAISRFNRWIAKYVLKLNLPYYCIVNILAQKPIFPELIVAESSPEQIALELENLIHKNSVRNECLNGCDEISKLLHFDSPSKNAAQAIETL